MLTKDVIQYFGNKARTAKAIGVTRGAIQAWKEVVPPRSALKVEAASNGALKFDREFYLNPRKSIGDQ